MFEDRLRKEDWEVREIPISTARELVEAHHYAKGASNTRVFTHGLFRRNDPSKCLGVAWWLPPTCKAARATYPDNWRGVLALSRLVIAPGVPKNACTFLLARSVKLIPKDVWPCLVTYADEWRGHTGLIYRACNWEYAGRTRATPTYLLNGVMTAMKATRTRTVSEMQSIGASLVGKFSKHKFVLKRFSP